MHDFKNEFTKGMKMTKRALLLVLLVVSLVAMLTGTALAADPSGNANPFTYTELDNTGEIGYNTGTPVGSAPNLGASAWSYTDVNGTKLEGSYKKFDDQVNELYTTNPPVVTNDASGTAITSSKGPHGGYSTTSNNCKVCHAVHRATGSFALLRVDSPDDACAYCHIGSHRHTSKQAYFNGANDSIYATNGHTIGAGMEIPDSSIWQWSENVTLTAQATGAESVFPVRRYMSQRNKIQRYTVHGGRMIRVAPNYLRCASCHQVHNATRQIWTPQWSGWGPAGGAAAAGSEMTDGYKLLRNSPSGGIKISNTDAATYANGPLAVANTNSSASALYAATRAVSRQYSRAFDPDFGADGVSSGDNYAIKALDETFSIADGSLLSDPTSAATGPNKTGYTMYKYFASTNKDAEIATNTAVYETSLAFWCADCHNLNIAGKQQVAGWGTGKGNDSMLADRSHAVPMEFRNTDNTKRAGAQCYACHNNDMPLDGKTDGCGGCHIGPRQYHYYKNGGTATTGQTWAQRAATAAGAVTASQTAVDYSDNGGAPRSDFPHSGPDNGLKLLSAVDRIGLSASDVGPTDSTWQVNGTEVKDVQGNAFLGYADGDKGLDHVCRQCHGGYKKRAVGYDK